MEALMNQAISKSLLALSAAALLTTTALAQKPAATAGYSVSVFAVGNDKYTAPDSIALAHGHIFIGYGGPGLPDGSDGKSSYILEYTVTGAEVHVYAVLGHNDGLKLNPYDGKLYALQNEDANPNLVIIDPVTKTQTGPIKFAALPDHGGGYDDMVFLNHKLYISCSNPAHNPNTRSAIVEARVGSLIRVREVLAGNASAITVPTSTTTTLNLQDPDSMIATPEGDLFLDSQGDSEVILVRHPDTDDQTVLQIPLSSPYGTPQIDDTIFTPSRKGFYLMADTPANTVYIISKEAFASGVAYSAAVGAPNSAGVSEGFVGKLDLDSGYITPVVTGFQSPHGMAFVPTDGDDDPWGKQY
jgi:hypothetical protein